MPLVPRTPRPLLLQELFDVILYFLAEPSRYEPHDCGIQVRTPDPEGRRALAALARTWRRFSEPSLNYLWRKLDSLEPLLRCFASRETVLSARRGLPPPSQADWVIINRYAHRIEELEVQNDSSCAFLACVIFEPALLPNLRVLKWKTRSNLNTIGITYIQPLLVPGLVALDVGATEHDTALGSFLRACPARCPNLTIVGFHIYVHGVEMVHTLSRAICDFKNLKSLTLEAPVNDCALRQILMSSELQELTLPLRQILLSRLDIPIRNVKKLDVTLKDLRPIINILRPGNQNFREITLRLQNLEFSETISSLFTSLTSHPERFRLQSLHLNNLNTGLHSYLKNCKLFVLSLDTFRPLTLLTNLRELTIGLENPISLNDDELADLAQNWPLLQVIELYYDRQLQAKCITFRGLLSLVAICPKLQAICLTLDGREFPSEVAGMSGPRYKMVTSLRFPNSPINDSRRVANLLQTHFPSVTSVTGVSETYMWGLGAGAVEKLAMDWAEVENYLVNVSELDGNELTVEDDADDDADILDMI